MKIYSLPSILMSAVFLAACSCVVSTAQTIVQTSSGKVEGVEAGGVIAFKGIPYAQPPVGDLRWQAPMPVKPWDSIKKANAFGNSCMQQKQGERLPWSKEFMVQDQISEDCLYLNIWEPIAHGSGKLPIYVFLHGGGFVEGSGSVAVYDGANFSKKGVLIVTINYRLGVFGFFAHPELTAESKHHASGNYGLLDAVAALQWIKENAAAFGGDPNRITVGGQSAGAAAVHDLIASPLAKGLFRGAVAESGSGIAFPMASLTNAEQSGRDFATKKGANSLAGLRKLTAEQILAVAPGDRAPRFGPVIDGWLLPVDPSSAKGKELANDVALLTGMQADDAGSFGAYAPMSLDAWHQQVEKRYGPMAEQFSRLYPASTSAELAKTQKESARQRGEASLYLWSKQTKLSQKAPIYIYYFNQAIPWPAHPEFGAFHTGEIPYILSNLDKLDRPFTSVDQTVAKQFSGYLANFVQSGNPNAPSLPHWSAVNANTSSAAEILELGGTTSMRPLMSPDKLAFWTMYFNSPQAKNAPLF